MPTSPRTARPFGAGQSRHHEAPAVTPEQWRVLREMYGADDAPTEVPSWVATFLAEVMAGLTTSHASLVAGVSHTAVYARARRDPWFARAWREATTVSVEALEREAERRAYHGVEEPVFYRGEQCGAVRRYSDSLLMFLLRGRRPEVYRDGVEDGGGRGACTVNIQVVGVDSLGTAPPVVALHGTEAGPPTTEAGTPAPQGVPEASRWVEREARPLPELPAVECLSTREAGGTGVGDGCVVDVEVSGGADGEQDDPGLPEAAPVS